MAEPVTHTVGAVVDTTRVCIDFVWRNCGSVELSNSGKTFRYGASIPSGPGVYRIRVHRDGEQVACYIGHSVTVRDRIADDVRANRLEIRAALQNGGNVQIDCVDDIHVAESDAIGGSVHPDRGEFARLMVEGVAVALESPNAGMINRARDRR